VNRGLQLAVAVGVALTLGQGSAFGAWNQLVGGSSPINKSSGDDASGSSLTNVNGVPYVAWVENDGTNTEVRVARLIAGGTAWEKVADSSSPINKSPSQSAGQPSLTTINDVPYVAWYESDGTNQEIRVARLNAAGTAWEKVADSASPINESASQSGFATSIAAVNGVPYVAWAEMDGVNSEIHVARLNAAGTAWDKVADSASPINKSPTLNATAPSLTAIGGVPYVAWSETDGTNSEIRVARLNATGTAWEKVADSASPINESPSRGAETPSLVAIAGVPYVAWFEYDGTGYEIRVARLNAAGTAWEKVADAASPINQVPSADAFSPSLAAFNGVPFVAWHEYAAGPAAYQLRVSRLEPEFVSQSVSPGPTTASLTATWHTYGVQFPLGFDYGSALESSTTPESAAAGSDSATVTQEISGLSPSTPYQFRSFATAGVPSPRLQAPTSSVFDTAEAPDTTPPQTKITKEPRAKSSKSKAKYKFKSSEPNSTFVCKFDKAKPKPCDSGKAKFKHLDDGKHKFKVIATDAAGNSDPSAAKDKFKVL
jgi:hypothetical protein